MHSKLNKKSIISNFFKNSSCGDIYRIPVERNIKGIVLIPGDGTQVCCSELSVVRSLKVFNCLIMCFKSLY